jgi:hypothetical protein
MKIKIFLLLSIIALVSRSLEAAPKDPFAKATETIKRAAVAVACGEQTGPSELSLTSVEGSGFFVSADGTFLTAAHVARGLYLTAPPRPKPCQVSVIYFPLDGWKSGVDVELLYFKINTCSWDDGLDLAKCKTVDNPFLDKRIKLKPLTVIFEASIQKEGTAIAFTGFPLGIIQPVTVHGTVAGYLGVTGEPSPREMILDHNNWPGASGSPVYLSNGKVVGLILLRGINDAVGFAYARSGEYLSKFLANSNATK